MAVTFVAYISCCAVGYLCVVDRDNVLRLGITRSKETTSRAHNATNGPFNARELHVAMYHLPFEPLAGGYYTQREIPGAMRLRFSFGPSTAA